MVMLSKDSEMPYIYIGLSRRYLDAASDEKRTRQGPPRFIGR